MTPTDIDKLEAGRELDALVAEGVMGLCAHVWEYKEVKPDPCPTCGEERNEEMYEAHGDYPPKICKKCGKKARGLAYSVGGIGKADPYSTSISAAWEVVEKLKHQFTKVIITGLDSDAPFEYVCEATYPYHVASAPTAPLAICRAALKAKLKGDTNATQR